MASLVKTWTFRSASNPNKAYEAQLHSDNTTSCNCMGWCIAKHGLRSCKHTRWVEQGVADRYADGVWENPNAQRVQEEIRSVRQETAVKVPDRKATVRETKFVTTPKRLVNWR